MLLPPRRIRREGETAQPPQRHGSGRKKDTDEQNNGMEVARVDYTSHATRFECLWAPKWRERKAGEIITQATKRATRQFCSSGGKEGRREGRGFRSPSVRRFVRSVVRRPYMRNESWPRKEKEGTESDLRECTSRGSASLNCSSNTTRQSGPMQDI